MKNGFIMYTMFVKYAECFDYVYIFVKYEDLFYNVYMSFNIKSGLIMYSFFSI